MITQVTYERLFNLGNYESERISATATVDGGDVEAAYAEAREAVITAHVTNASLRQSTPETASTGVSYTPVAPPLATEKQMAFIRSLAADLDWTDEKLADFAAINHPLGYDITIFSRDDASALIGLLKKETREERIIDWSKRVSGAPAEKPGTVGEAEIPF